MLLQTFGVWLVGRFAPNSRDLMPGLQFKGSDVASFRAFMQCKSISF